MKPLNKVGALALIASLVSAPVFAQDFYQDASMSEYAGFYLTVPFGGAGGRYQQQDHMRFGFVTGYRKNSIDTAYLDPTGRRPAMLPVTTVDFSISGFERIQLSGVNILSKGSDGRLRFLSADQSDDKEDPGLGKILLIGAGIAGGILVLGIAGICADDVLRKEDDFELTECPI